MYYCDRNCQTIDWKYHKNECKVFRNKRHISEELIFYDKLLRLYLTIKSDETFSTKRHKLFNGSDVCLKEIEVNVKDMMQNNDRVIEFEEICNQLI